MAVLTITNLDTATYESDFGPVPVGGTRNFTVTAAELTAALTDLNTDSAAGDINYCTSTDPTGMAQGADATNYFGTATINSLVAASQTISGDIVVDDITCDDIAADAITAASVAATGAVSGATVAATGAVTGASVTATAAVAGATLAATGAATAASFVATGAVQGATVTATASSALAAATAASLAATGAVSGLTVAASTSVTGDTVVGTTSVAGAALVATASTSTVDLTATGAIATVPVTVLFAASPFTATAKPTFLCDTVGGAIVFNLPAASAISGRRICVKKTNSDVATVTVTRAGADTIDGATTVVLKAQFDYLVIESDGTSKWNIFASVITP